MAAVSLSLIHILGDSKIGIVTDGTAYQYVKEAMPEASVLKLGMVYPIAMDQVKALSLIHI